MSKFNLTTKGSTKTVNHEGEEAYILPEELELYSLVCTSMLDNKFYVSEYEVMNRLRKLIKKVSPEFIAKLAVYAREEMHLRTMPIVLAVELAKIHNGDDLVSRLTERIIQRADELTEILACYAELNGQDRINKLSKQIQKGVARAFNKFNEYHFAKYNRKKNVTLKDALFVTHPKPKDKEQEELFNRIANDELETPYTWEVEVSKVGENSYSSEEEKNNAFRSKWEELIESEKLGYMATLRNLRNMLYYEVSDGHIDKVCKFISDPQAVKRSRQLPFRFFSAFKVLCDFSCTVNNLDKVLNALNEAVKLSIDNIPFLVEGKNVIACDVSGSMRVSLSRNSSIQNFDVGILLGQLLKLKSEDTLIGIFGDKWKVKDFSDDNVLENTTSLKGMSNEVGLSTNGYKVIDYLIERNLEKNKIFIFTDCQMWDSRMSESHFKDSWREYKKFSPNAQLYLFDLSGYGTTPVSVLDDDVTFISGWSNSVFDMLDSLENGGDVVSEIDKIVL